MGGWSGGPKGPDVEGPHPLPSSTPGAGGRGTLLSGGLHPKQNVSPHMLGSGVVGVFLEISGNRSK